MCQQMKFICLNVVCSVNAVPCRQKCTLLIRSSYLSDLKYRQGKCLTRMQKNIVFYNMIFSFPWNKKGGILFSSAVFIRVRALTCMLWWMKTIELKACKFVAADLQES